MKNPKAVWLFKNPKELAETLAETSFRFQAEFLRDYADEILKLSQSNIKNEFGAWLASAFTLIKTTQNVFEKIWKICREGQKTGRKI